MNILTFTSLYPNGAQPRHGIFVENRLRHLVESGLIKADVVAPVPWFPSAARIFGKYAQFSGVPKREERFGIEIAHPRYPVVPKVGMSIAPLLMYAAMRPVFQHRLRAGRRFDLIDAHYFYPDGVAAVMLGRRFGKPVVITARGTDVNVIPRYSLPRRMIRWAAANAAAVITVSEALRMELARIGGVDPARVHVLRNGVDLRLFRPTDRTVARARLGLEAPTLLSVGNLIPLKGHDLVIRALTRLPEALLLIVGQGHQDQALRRLAFRLGVESRVRFLGGVAHSEMPDLYGAADVLVLASEREGLANVLLEAMACGTPVVAANVSGNPEVVTDRCAGALIPERTAEAVAETVRALLANPPQRDATRSHAERFGWEETTRRQLELFRAVLATRMSTHGKTQGSQTSQAEA